MAAAASEDDNQTAIEKDSEKVEVPTSSPSNWRGEAATAGRQSGTEGIWLADRSRDARKGWCAARAASATARESTQQGGTYKGTATGVEKNLRARTGRNLYSVLRVDLNSASSGGGSGLACLGKADGSRRRRTAVMTEPWWVDLACDGKTGMTRRTGAGYATSAYSAASGC